MQVQHLSLSEARRVALAAQGFDRPRPNHPTARDVRRVIHQLTLLQIDYVNILVPAQYQVIFSRLGPYSRSVLDDLVYRKREFTEQWAHEASIIPVETWPLLRHRMEVHRVRPWGFEKFMAQHPEYVEQVLEEVRTRGPLSGEELHHPEGTERKIEYSWVTVPRAVLEAHFGRGTLAIADRRSDFSRVFDLAERVIHADHRNGRVDRETAQRALLRKAARAHGVGTAADLADYYRMPVRDARPRLSELVEAGELHLINIDGWREPAFLHANAKIPKSIGAAALLSPFDPVVWFRPRTARLFEFEYRFEIFVPAEKRRWGCYVLPFLLGDRLVARVDLKADRSARSLLVLAAYLEEHPTADEVIEPLAKELRTMAGWLGLESLAVTGHGSFSKRLRAAVRSSKAQLPEP